MCFAALGCAGGKPVVEPGSLTGDVAADNARGEPDPVTTDAGPSDAGGDGGTHAAEGAPPPVVDPAVAHALVAKSGEGAGATPLGLRFEVMELGAELPWAFAVVNRGTEAAVVNFDARLLSLEISPPAAAEPEAASGKAKALKAAKPKKPPKPVLCRLPADVVPSSADPALAIKLEPGEGLVQNFDPRLYCVGKTPWPLVEGAQLSAHFGWPVKMKTTWKGGKREEQPAVQREPFVAEPIEAQGSLPAADAARDAEKAEASEASERRIKELNGTPFTLGSNFGGAVKPPPGAPAKPPGLELSISGSDAANESAVTATTTLTNRGPRKQDVYFRREMVTYEVSGPDGVFQCDPQPDRRSPADRSAVQTLRPGGKSSAVTRLIEMCPAHAFARPGLYLVHARFDAADPATELGFNAFMGRLVSAKPALVRVRRGELPFTPSSGAVRVRVGE
ncbi:MAG TPA: hypothetical protein VJV79_33250 [Polyangiaceae bacterium]|nr:hypothetical protein [Polyangiaceae bacterium]